MKLFNGTPVIINPDLVDVSLNRAEYLSTLQSLINLIIDNNLLLVPSSFPIIQEREEFMYIYRSGPSKYFTDTAIPISISSDPNEPIWFTNNNENAYQYILLDIIKRKEPPRDYILVGRKLKNTNSSTNGLNLFLNLDGLRAENCNKDVKLLNTTLMALIYRLIDLEIVSIDIPEVHYGAYGHSNNGKRFSYRATDRLISKKINEIMEKIEHQFRNNAEFIFNDTYKVHMGEKNETTILGYYASPLELDVGLLKKHSTAATPSETCPIFDTEVTIKAGHITDELLRNQIFHPTRNEEVKHTVGKSNIHAFIGGNRTYDDVINLVFQDDIRNEPLTDFEQLVTKDAVQSRRITLETIKNIEAPMITIPQTQMHTRLLAAPAAGGRKTIKRKRHHKKHKSINKHN